MLRRIRTVTCVTAVTLASILAFGVGARKTVALTVDGKTTTVTTYAMSVDRLLQEQQVKVKTHDLVESTSNGTLQNHSVVTVRSAYQTTITIDGQEVPFWTVATSADQLLGFFEENEAEASKITVNIDNVYNKLTGGMVINQSGPVTVIADGKSSVAPNGKLPAASILDSKGIILNKEDRVSVEKDNGETILRVQRVTHDEQTRTKIVPHGTQTIIDASLQPGETVVRQEGEDGEIQQTYDVTYVDGVEESEKLINEVTTKIAIDQIIAVGPEKTENSDSDNADNGQADSGSNDDDSDKSDKKDKSDDKDSDSTDKKNDSSNKDDSSKKNDSTSTPTTEPTQTPTPTPTPTPTQTQTQQSQTQQTTNASSGCRLYHPSAAQAQTYAAGAAAQYGWTGQNWTDLVKLWNRESSWMWSAENASSGAYGIPQSLPGSKMAAFGANWRDDAAVQIDWGLNYIAQRYGNPTKAWEHSEQHGWY